MLRDRIRRTRERVNTRLDLSIARAKIFTQESKSFFGSLKKLIGQYGISFLIGVAVGINLILLLQLSENTFGILSEPIAGSILGIVGVVSTFVVGVTIFYMQKKVAKRVNTLVEQQHKMIENKSERDQGTKR
jgi:VIT1/CCC1 family predicted Fe2+/Mn2+ transporter